MIDEPLAGAIHLGPVYLKYPRHQIEVGGVSPAKGAGDRPGALLDGSKRNGGLPVEKGGALLPHLLHEGLERVREPAGGRRVGRLLVDDASRRRLQGAGQRGSGLGDIEVCHARQALGLGLRDHVLKQEEELILPFSQFPDRGQQHGHIRLLLAFRGGGRVCLRRYKVHAAGRAVDFRQAFGGAAHGADAGVQRWAIPLCLALAAQGTGHGREASHRTLENPRKLRKKQQSTSVDIST